MDSYFKELDEKIKETYRIAEKARALGLDPSLKVEALPAGDLASRVEGLVGPEGIAEKIKEYGRDNIKGIIDFVLGDVSSLPRKAQEQRIDQALRTALAVITEGVVAAPIEGIAHVAIKSNPDGSDYLSVYFSGPIRSAGGTAQGLAVLFADYLRKKANLQEYRPTKDEVERYLEEIKIYHERVSRLQYKPSDDDIREIVNRCPICVDGDPTEKREVSIHRNLQRIETNRIRGGMCLVIAEGIAQKAKKLLNYNELFGLDWGWLSSLGKHGSADEAKKGAAFMSEIVGGRPIFAEPSAKGGFRLRYGRSRSSGIAAKSIHPAAMILLDGFIATGTQVKVEHPGKGCIITECDTIEGPIVKLKDGCVVRVENREQAQSLKDNLAEILFLGDMLVTYGDFLQTNTALLPAGFCEEWWLLELEDKNVPLPEKIPSPEEAVNLSLTYKVPLHPRYTYRWNDLSSDDLSVLVDWLSSGEVDSFLVIENNNPEAKRVLECLGVPHRVEDNNVIIEEFIPLLYSLGIFVDGRINTDKFSSLKESGKESVVDFLNSVSSLTIRPKSGSYVGARMGRPEKARERKMQPPVHSLFPIGLNGGAERNISLAAGKGSVSVEVARFECPKCGLSSIHPMCPRCSKPAVLKKVCPSCGRPVDTRMDKCPKCRTTLQGCEKKDLNLQDMWRSAVERVGFSRDVKGVQGMISFYKVPEPLEKGLLRSKYDVFVFKDGSIRFDATDAPLTHFRPREVNVSVEKLGELGYTRDYLGNDLVDEEQLLELRVQDIILPVEGASYLQRVSSFIDELLTRFYGLEPFYNVSSRDDLLGHLVVGLAPHTSAAITGRIIGFCNANVCFAHPFWHAAKRRNADGDEDSVMLLLDALINFSRMYLPEKRGGKMDAPLVVTTLLDPREVDDEAHKIEVCSRFSLDFYKKTWLRVNPSEVDVPIVNSFLDSDPFHSICFSHDSFDVSGPVTESRYVLLDSMEEKVDAQLHVAVLSRAVNESTVAELVINSHFLRDTYGNLRAFSRQKFRCVKCNKSYRRVPLVGKCTKCGGRLLLTVTEGSVRKYLDISINLADKYSHSDYLKQRLSLLNREITSVFTNDLNKQVSLSDFM
ncbi:MAG: DNA polymerase II large subunit [Candidatus Altiarchaeota archaeon]|nr:DNA polymerase II large subunit [Candidatus Altiarchaeota archaeon]